jgi:hypothetical protein
MARRFTAVLVLFVLALACGCAHTAGGTGY